MSNFSRRNENRFLNSNKHFTRQNTIWRIRSDCMAFCQTRFQQKHSFLEEVLVFEGHTFYEGPFDLICITKYFIHVIFQTAKQVVNLSAKHSANVGQDFVAQIVQLAQDHLSCMLSCIAVKKDRSVSVDWCRIHCGKFSIHSRNFTTIWNSINCLCRPQEWRMNDTSCSPPHRYHVLSTIQRWFRLVSWTFTIPMFAGRLADGLSSVSQFGTLHTK